VWCHDVDVEGVSASELQQLMTLRGEECVQLIQQQYGGIEQLCERLDTHPDHGVLSLLCCTLLTLVGILLVDD